jgi:hypothetical protein
MRPNHQDGSNRARRRLDQSTAFDRRLGQSVVFKTPHGHNGAAKPAPTEVQEHRRQHPKAARRVVEGGLSRVAGGEWNVSGQDHFPVTLLKMGLMFSRGAMSTTQVDISDTIQNFETTASWQETSMTRAGRLDFPVKCCAVARC